ncbi:4278_t:CDS:1, partial [Paraglomus brasilianum]
MNELARAEITKSTNVDPLESDMARNNLYQTDHPYSITAKITANKSKMKLLQGPFAKAYTLLNEEQCDFLRKLYLELEDDPLHPLFADDVFPKVQQTLEYLSICPKRRNELLSSLQQLMSERPSAKPDKDVHAEHIRSNSNKREITSACTVPSDSPKKRHRKCSDPNIKRKYGEWILNFQQEHQVYAAREIEELDVKELAATNKPLSQEPYDPTALSFFISEDQWQSLPISDYELTANTYYAGDGFSLSTDDAK